MDRFDRIYALHNILSNSRYPVSGKKIQERIECSRATFARIVEDLRDFLGAPIEYSRKYKGYHYSPSGEHPYELPGLWFNASEIQSLLTSYELLKNAQPGLLDQHIEPLKDRISDILKKTGQSGDELAKRVKILKMAFRKVNDEIFSECANATISRKKLLISYHGRESNQDTERKISPQRLVLYRDNWYLDVLCHLRNGLRTFSVDRIEKATILKERAKTVSEKKLNSHFSESYGIFSGKPKHKAVLQFSKSVSPWVSNGQWHPKQEGKFIGDVFELTIPFSDARELIIDILSYGSSVKVISPPFLISEIKRSLEKALQQYNPH